MQKQDIIKRYPVESDSTPGQTWEVVEWADESFICNCPAFTRSRAQTGLRIWERSPCKHIRRMMAQLGKEV